MWRFICRTAGRTVSLLPVCFAAWVPGPLEAQEGAGADGGGYPDSGGGGVAGAATGSEVPQAQLAAVLEGKAHVPPQLALDLEQVGRSTAEYWMRLQAAYDPAQEHLRRAAVAKCTLSVGSVSGWIPFRRSSIAWGFVWRVATGSYDVRGFDTRRVNGAVVTVYIPMRNKDQTNDHRKHFIIAAIALMVTSVTAFGQANPTAQERRAAISEAVQAIGLDRDQIAKIREIRQGAGHQKAPRAGLAGSGARESPRS